MAPVMTSSPREQQLLLTESHLPLPAPLIGVKSRAKKIFTVREGAALDLDGSSGKAVSVQVADELSLTHESRVVAVGAAGRAAVEKLLDGAAKSQLLSPRSGSSIGSNSAAEDDVSVHPDLQVFHLGPHLLLDSAKEGRSGGAASSCGLAEPESEPGAPESVGKAAEDQAIAGFAAASGLLRESRAQVLVLDQGRHGDGAPTKEDAAISAWDPVFWRLLRSDALRNYRGAVVVIFNFGRKAGIPTVEEGQEEVANLLPPSLSGECWGLDKKGLLCKRAAKVILTNDAPAPTDVEAAAVLTQEKKISGDAMLLAEEKTQAFSGALSQQEHGLEKTKKPVGISSGRQDEVVKVKGKKPLAYSPAPSDRKSSPAAASSAAAAATEEVPELLERVDLYSEEAQTPGTYLWDLLEETRALAVDTFDEDVLQLVRDSRESRIPLELVVLCRRRTDQSAEEHVEEKTVDGSRGGGGNALLGFIVVQFIIDERELYISRLAVPARFRGAGYGKLLMDFATARARSIPGCRALECSSLSSSVSFYKKLGFQMDEPGPAAREVVEFERLDSLPPGQIWMKCKVGRPAPKKAAARISRGKTKEAAAACCDGGEAVVLLEKVDLTSEEAKTPGTYLHGLLTEASELCDEAFKDEGGLLRLLRRETTEEDEGGAKQAAEKSPWNLAVLARPRKEDVGALSSSDGCSHNLLGFLVWRFRSRIGGKTCRSVRIVRVAVPRECRGRGYGKRLMQAALSQARQLPREICGAVVCGAPPEAVPFYRRFGFEPAAANMEEEATLERPSRSEKPGVPAFQVWMRYRLD